MTPQQLVSMVRNLAGDASANQFTNAMITEWLNAAQREIVVSNSLLQKTATSATVAGTFEYNLPTDIFKLHSVSVDGQTLAIRSIQNSQQVLDDIPVGNTKGHPETVYVWAGKMSFFPAPDAAYTIKVYYTCMPTNIVYADPTWTPNLFDVPESYHNRIVTYCLAQVALQDDDHNKYQVLMQEFQTGVIATQQQGQSEEDLYPFMSVSNRDMGDAYDYSDYTW